MLEWLPERLNHTLACRALLFESAFASSDILNFSRACLFTPLSVHLSIFSSFQSFTFFFERLTQLYVKVSVLRVGHPRIYSNRRVDTVLYINSNISF